MALVRSTDSSADRSLIEGRGVFLRYPQLGDFEAWANLRGESRAFLVPWEPIWPSDDLTRAAYRRRVKRYTRDVKEDLAYPYFVFQASDGALVGGATISNVRRGVAQACNLGYWVGEKYARNGLISAAVEALIPFIFETLKLNRIESSCLPSNKPSRGLLKKVGYTEEGYARKYLKINGEWQDHVLFAMVKGDLVPSKKVR